MKYPDGQDIRLGDVVNLGGGMTGMVVIDVENSKFTERFDLNDVFFLKDGIMLDTDRMGLVHLPADHDHYISLISRQA